MLKDKPLSPAMRDALVSLARHAAPREICGFIREDPFNGTHTICPITNVSEKDGQFEMDKVELIAYYKRWLNWNIGIYHSHPEGSKRPSEKDIDFAPAGMRYWVVTFDGVFEWELSDDRKLIGVAHGQPAA